MKVLFVVKEYLPKPTPPGLCIMNVQRALLEKGVQSDVLMAGEEEGLYGAGEFGEVYSICAEISFEKGKESTSHYLKTRIPMLVTWPIPSMKRVRDYRRVIDELNERNHYDAIIGTMFPPDVCLACSAFDHFIYYELDSLINNPVYKEGAKKYLTHRLYGLERVLFDRAEMIIHLNNNKRFYSKERYQKYAMKSVYADIPNLVRSGSGEGKTGFLPDGLAGLKDEQILMVYSGHLSKEYRPPTKLIELIEGVSKKIDVKCLFFSRGDCEDELRRAEKETDGVIKRMGYVSQEELSGYMAKADFLLDIGNRLTGEDYSLPSKVISYFAEGKPIIHINGVNDSAVRYLEKYGLALNIGDERPFDAAVQEILDFIRHSRGKRIPFSEAEQLFPQNTPAYTADLIIAQIKKRAGEQ